MKRSLHSLLLVCAVISCGAVAHDHGRADDAGYTIKSLNAPDPIFTAGESIAVRVSAKSSKAASKVVLRLNGHDVSSALAEVAPGVLEGMLVGLQPGINSFEVFKNRGERRAVAGLKVARAKAPAVSCSVASFPAAALPVPNTAVTSATPVAATATVPAHCLVIGTINAGRVGAETSPGAPVSRYTYAINWQARLPDAWNSKFHMPGGGGTDGSVPNTTTRLRQGYAAAANDSGHSNAVNSDPLAGGTASFGTDYVARVDFAYNAIDVTTRTAKKLLEMYYGDWPEYSYFEGCSMGGREAMMVTQRLPSYFDGAVSGDPAFRITKVGVWAMYTGQQLAALARTRGLISGFGVPYANNTFTNQDLQLISKAILDACDALDGVADGMVSNSQACTTRRVKPRLDALRCEADKTPTCLASDQVDAILNIYASGAPNSRGKPQYAPWMWDAGIAGCTSTADCNTPTATNINTGWRLWNVGIFNAAFVPGANVSNGALSFASLGGGAIPLLFATPPILPAPTANDGLANLIMNHDFDTFAASIFGTSAAFPVSDTELLNVDDTDLSPFKRRGGKIIIWQPQSGGPFSPQDMVNWYTQMSRVMGGKGQGGFEKTQEFARLFMMPGVNHCGGGPGTSSIDAFSPLVEWVENGNAPDTILGTAPATGNPFPGRTRALCPYPAYAKYKGSGSIELAESFECHVDKHRGHNHGHDQDDHDHHGHGR
jgi:feruloyl esterase